MLKIRTSPESFFVFVLFIPFLLVWHTAEIYKVMEFTKPLFYFLPVLGTLSVLAYNFYTPENKLTLDTSYIQLALVYVLLVCVSLLFNFNEIYWETFFRDLLIFLLPLVFFCFKLHFTDWQFKAIFLAGFLCYFIWTRFKFSFVLLSSFLVSNFHFSVEYHFGCIAGLFIVYFLYKKQWLWLAASVVFMLLVNKRANILGLFPAIVIFYLFVIPFKLHKKKISLFIFLLIYYMTFWAIGTNIEASATFFLKLLGKEEIDLDYFLTGRMILITHLQPEITERGIVAYLFGNGPGQADAYLWKTISSPIYDKIAKPYLVHNDFLKLQFDVGLFGAVLYFFICYYLYACSPLGIFVFLYTIPLFLIDNTLIFLYNILVGAVAARVMDKDEHTLSSPPLSLH